MGKNHSSMWCDIFHKFIPPSCPDCYSIFVCVWQLEGKQQESNFYIKFTVQQEWIDSDAER